HAAGESVEYSVMSALAAGTFWDQLMMPQLFVVPVVKRPFGPAGWGEMRIFWARSGVCFSIVRRALIGLWIQAPLPEARSWLLAVSSQERTSSVIALLYSSSPNLRASLTSGALIVTVLLSAATVDPPNDQMSVCQEDSESLHFWLTAMPIWLPFSFRSTPALSKSSQVSTGFRPLASKRSFR